MEITRNCNAKAALQIVGEVVEVVGVVARIAGQVAGLLAEQPVFWLFCAAVGFVAGMGACFSTLL